MGGSNFADVPSTGKYTYSERAIPYVENEAAYHTGTFNDVTYFDKIDAIKNGDIDTFNELLHNEGISLSLIHIYFLHYTGDFKRCFSVY